MEDILQRLDSVSQDPYSYVANKKAETGKKVIGLTPMHLPEELFHASGVLPVEMWSSNEPITVAHSHLTPYYCGLTRSIVDDFLKGKLSFVDGLVAYETCIQARTLMLIIEKNYNLPFADAIFLPNQLKNPLTRPYLIETLQILKSRLEEFTGLSMKTEDLENSISIYNKNRNLLREINEIRNKRPGAIGIREMVSIVHSSMIMLKEEHNEMLEKLIPLLQARQPQPDSRVGIIMVGSLCTPPSTEFLKLFDDSGFVVVADDMYTGSRYFANDVMINGDPLEALADRFLEKIPPCPTKVDPETNWGDYLIEMVKGSGALGVVTLIQKNCPPHMCYSPDVMRSLGQAGIPELVLEVEHEVVSLEQIRTRLQAFRETLGGI